MDRLKNKILFCGYRHWALNVYDTLPKGVDLVISPESFNEIISKNTYDIIFFIGWSWIIPENIINSTTCICLHPSPLPLYRGGSPLQHQIINGEDKSAVTLFIMTEKVDDGPILWQKEFSLKGELEVIFQHITNLGIEGINYVLTVDDIHKAAVPQNNNKATFFKRRTPSQSEIKTTDFNQYTAEQMYNKIRALQGSYPNPYILCKDGTKLFITQSYVETN